MKNINIWSLLFGLLFMAIAARVYQTGLIRSVIDVGQYKEIISITLFLFGSYFVFISFK
jgi:hypothetical protein